MNLKPSFFVVSTLLVTEILLFGCSGNKVYYCPPTNEPVTVPRNPMKAYQSFVKTTNTNIKGTINITETLKIADLDLGTKTEVAKLRENLDQFSSRYQDVIKGSYLAFTGAPCDKDVRKKHFELLADMSRENIALEKLKVELDKIVKSGHLAGPDESKIKSVISEYQKESVAEKVR